MITHEHEAKELISAESPASVADNAALAELKNEILNSLNENKGRAPLAWNSTTVSIVLGVLALISVIQVVQSVALYNKLKSGNFQPTASIPASGSSSSLPTQVGGC